MGLSLDTSTLMSIAQNGVEGKGETGTENLSKTTGVSKTEQLGQKWSVPKWEKGFKLEEALSNAYFYATEHMNKLLEKDDLYMDIEVQGIKTKGKVKEREDDKIVKEYEGLDILRLYTHNVREKGIVVDGAL